MTEVNTIQDVLAAAGSEEMSGARFAELVSAASDDQLKQIVDDPEARTAVLDRIFKQMEERVKPERAKGMHEIVHWQIVGRPGGGGDVYQVTIDDGKVHVSKDADGKPRVTMEIEPVPFLRMIAGQTTGMKLVLGRKLKVKGDMMFAPRIEQLFNTDPTAI